jgi:hypothetical protein
MYAVVRETSYSIDVPLGERPEFKAFQDAHRARPGYLGTVVTHLGHGRYITVTLWDSPEHMTAAREAIGPVVEQLIAPLLTAPSRLIGTGEVAYADGELAFAGA